MKPFENLNIKDHATLTQKSSWKKYLFTFVAGLLVMLAGTSYIYVRYLRATPVAIVKTTNEQWADEHPRQMAKAIADWTAFQTKLQAEVIKAENDYFGSVSPK